MDRPPRNWSWMCLPGAGVPSWVLGGMALTGGLSLENCGPTLPGPEGVPGTVSAQPGASWANQAESVSLLLGRNP